MLASLLCLESLKFWSLRSFLKSCGCAFSLGMPPRHQCLFIINASALMMPPCHLCLHLIDASLSSMLLPHQWLLVINAFSALTSHHQWLIITHRCNLLENLIISFTVITLSSKCCCFALLFSLLHWSTLEADEINECQPDFSQLLERFHA